MCRNLKLGQLFKLLPVLIGCTVKIWGHREKTANPGTVQTHGIAQIFRAAQLKSRKRIVKSRVQLCVVIHRSFQLDKVVSAGDYAY